MCVYLEVRLHLYLYYLVVLYHSVFPRMCFKRNTTTQTEAAGAMKMVDQTVVFTRS